jgi:hypothetical protein
MLFKTTMKKALIATFNGGMRSAVLLRKGTTVTVLAIVKGAVWLGGARARIKKGEDEYLVSAKEYLEPRDKYSHER